MRKIIGSVILLGAFISGYADTCPSPNALTFKQIPFPTPNAKGTILGTASDGTKFSTLVGTYVLHPLELGPGNIVLNTSFRNMSGKHFQQHGNTTTCYYKYTGFTGKQVYLNLRGTRLQ